MDFKKMTDKEIDDYIISKLNFKESELISPLVVKYDKFIQPNSACMANVAKAHAFKMDCFDAYREFLRFYRDSRFGSSIFEKIEAVDIFQNKYLGTTRNDEKRQSVNLSLPDLHSIRVYKDCAVCFERGALAQNLLRLLGEESSLITKNNHTYNLIKTEKSYIIYDPTNPTSAVIKGNPVVLASVKMIPNRLQDVFLYGEKDMQIDTFFYEAMHGAKEVRVPKIIYKGLSLPQPATESEEPKEIE